MNTILKNLISLTAEGAFSAEKEILPMNAFKWNVLYKIAQIEDVAPYIYKGILRHESDNRTNIPEALVESFAKAVFNNKDEITSSFDITDTESQKLTYVLKKYLLKDIVYKERHSIDTSKISLDLLSIILQNTNIIIRYGIRLRGIVELGIFLRTKGQYVDFVKIEGWLQKLKLRRMASLQASILVDFFSFEADEFPYIKKLEKKSRKLTEYSLDKVYSGNKHEREFKKYSISNCVKFHEYSRSEAFFKGVSTIVRSLSEIEE